VGAWRPGARIGRTQLGNFHAYFRVDERRDRSVFGTREEGYEGYENSFLLGDVRNMPLKKN
jgi:hypothetical protein